jgi:hypothetical protein
MSATDTRLSQRVPITKEVGTLEEFCEMDSFHDVRRLRNIAAAHASRVLEEDGTDAPTDTIEVERVEVVAVGDGIDLSYIAYYSSDEGPHGA